MHRLPCFWLGIVLIVVLGCSDENDPVGDESEANAPDPIISATLQRDSFAGNWALVVYQRSGGQLVPQPVSIALLEIDELPAGEFELSVLQTANADQLQALRPDATLTARSVHIDDDMAHIELDLQGTIIDFLGEFQGDLVRGTASIGQSPFFPADLIATNLDSLSVPDPLAGVMSYEDALQSSDRVANLREFAREHSDSPLALEAMQQAVSEVTEKRLGTEQLEATLTEYRQVADRWGERMHDMVVVRVAMSLPQSGLAPEIALQYVNDALTRVEGTALQQLKPALRDQRTLVKVRLAEIALKSEDTDEKTEARAALEAMLANDPFNYQAQFVLANHAAGEGRAAVALQLYAELAAMPQVESLLASSSAVESESLPLPRAQVERLWKEQHGELDGLDGYLDEVFSTRVEELAESSDVFSDAAPQTETTVLVELFTGGSCAPCVAADLALAGLEHKVPQQTVIGVRYHEHIPAPDPLTNSFSEARFDYYRNRGTPTICVNGVPDLQFAGPVTRARESLRLLAESVAEKALTEPLMQVAASASRDDGTLTLSAEVTAAESIDPGWRLRMLLVQKELAFLANNGVRVHHNVVRYMPAGVDGIAPEDGRLQFRATLELESVREELEQYLQSFENGTGYKFRQKPLELGELQFVAFVQDDATRRVLQSVIVPVSDLAGDRPTDETQSSESPPEATPKPQPETDEKSDSETTETTKPDTASEPDAESDKQPDTESGTESDAEPEADTNTAAKPDTDT